MKRLLLGTSLLLIAILAVQWMDWPAPVPTVSDGVGPPAQESSPATDSSSTPSPDLDLLKPEEDYVTVMERPLFLPDRRPLPDEPADTAVDDPSAEAADLAQVDVNATLILSPSQASVWLRDPTLQDLVRLRLGDEYQGWTVSEINPDNIRMERQGVTETLELFNYSAQASPPGRPPGRPQPRVNQPAVRLPNPSRRQPPAGQQPGPK